MLWHLKDMEGSSRPTPRSVSARSPGSSAQQSGDGSWPSGDALHAGNEVLGTSAVRTTAFIAWALAHTGWADEAVGRARGWLRANLPDASDLYANALAANALGMVDADGRGDVDAVVAPRRRSRSRPRRGRLKWPTETPSWTGASR
jgi:hypothetical protein